MRIFKQNITKIQQHAKLHDQKSTKLKENLSINRSPTLDTVCLKMCNEGNISTVLRHRLRSVHLQGIGVEMLATFTHFETSNNSETLRLLEFFPVLWFF
jgi:hypothetical protein